MNRLQTLLLSCMLLTLPGISLAAPCVVQETEAEKVALARIYTVLNGLKPLIAEAKSAQDKTARIQFRYQQLEADLCKIQTGIDAYFHPPCLQPRVLRPIDGDYVNY
jgi:RAQPRD family integrative conjugative element protein